jgi:hypothetical protein
MVAAEMNTASTPVETLLENPNSRVVIVGQILCILVPLVVWFAPLGLEPVTQHGFAIVGFMVVAWITRAMDYALAGFVGCFLFWALGMQMAEAVARQQGQDTPWVKLAKRCLPGRDFCTTALDANFVGIGGVQEPRKVILIVATDIHDPNLQVSRMVCIRPTSGKQVCRDWNTGKLVTDEQAQ